MSGTQSDTWQHSLRALCWTRVVTTQALTLYPVVDFALLGLSMAYLGVLP